MDKYLEYAEKILNASEEVKLWATTTLAAFLKNNTPPQEQVEHILDYLASNAAPTRLRKMSYQQAHTATLAWSKSLEKKGHNINERDTDVETIHDFGDGSRIVKLIGKNAYLREGHLMHHCVGSYADKNVTIYSYRDAKNMPHATFEVAFSGGSIVQVKGKGNGAIHPRYINPILAFLKSINQPVRSSEMINLGYIKLSKQAEHALSILNVSLPDIQLFGETYKFIGQ